MIEFLVFLGVNVIVLRWATTDRWDGMVLCLHTCVCGCTARVSLVTTGVFAERGGLDVQCIDALF